MTLCTRCVYLRRAQIARVHPVAFVANRNRKVTGAFRNRPQCQNKARQDGALGKRRPVAAIPSMHNVLCALAHG